MKHIIWYRNYRQGLRLQDETQQLTENISLPFAIKTSSILLFIFLVFLLAVPLSFISNWFITTMSVGGFIIIYGIVPFLIVQLVNSLHPDGKNVYVYIYDFFVYFFRYHLNNKKICHGQRIETLDQVVYLNKIQHGKELQHVANHVPDESYQE